MSLLNIINELFRALPLLSSLIFGIIYFKTNDLYMLYIFIGTFLTSITTYLCKN